MNLADFSLELTRIVEELERSNDGTQFSDFIVRGRNLAREAMGVHLEQWFALNPDDLNTVPN